MVTKETIDLYFTGKYNPDPYRKAAKDILKALRVHTAKETPTELLTKSRPNEEKAQTEYRKANYEPITNGYFNKVLAQANKFGRAEDWAVSFPADVEPNPLKDFTAGNFPEFDTLENWFFSFALKKLLEDPNGVFAVMPAGVLSLVDTEKLPDDVKPNIYYFTSNEVLVNRADLTVIARLEDNKGVSRRAFYFLDKDQIVIVREIDAAAGKYEKIDINHGHQYKPVITLGGPILNINPVTNAVLYESFITPAVAYWNRALDRDSDHIVNLNQHINPDRWELETLTCTPCAGTGFDKSNTKSSKTPCSHCGGTGTRANRSALGVTRIAPVQDGDGGLKFPDKAPFGYGERPLEAIKIIGENVDQNIYKGLEALGLEKIILTPLNISAAAKDLDRSESRAFVADLGKHAVENILRPLYFFINNYLNIGLAEDARAKYLPVIAVPKKIDLATSQVYRERAAQGRESKESPAIIAFNEIKLAESEFGPDSPDFLAVKATVELDPLYGQTPEQKAESVLNGGCTQLDYILSTKIGFYVRRAAIESKGKFFTLEYAAQTAQLVAYAQETATALNKSKLLMPEPGLKVAN